MTAIIYLDNEPFYCGNFNVNELCYFNEPVLFTIIDIENIALMIREIKKINYVYHLKCEVSGYAKFMKNGPTNIKHHYKKTPGRITPIWFENDCGKQITFLIE